MTAPSRLLLVRFKSPLTLSEVTEIIETRAAEFRALRGLQQKYYLEDAATGEYAGLYLWESSEYLVEFQESVLRATITQAYQVDGEPRVEVYRVIKALRDESA